MKKPLKFIKILGFNLLFIAFILLFAEICCLVYECNIILGYCKDESADKKILALENFIKASYKKDLINIYNFRNPSYAAPNQKTSKSSIIIAGGSYTYGWLLDNKDAFHSVLAENSNRTVYNLGIGSGSPREMLYTLRNNELFDELTNNDDNVEYYIYTFINNHIRRLYYDLDINAPYYKPDKTYSRLIFKKTNFFQHFFIYKDIYCLLKFRFSSQESKSKLFMLYLKEIQKEINTKFGKNGKTPEFIILIYPQDESINWKEIENLNIKVISAEQLTSVDLDTEEYKASDNAHPGAKAWQVIVPALVKELGL